MGTQSYPQPSKEEKKEEKPRGATSNEDCNHIARTREMVVDITQHDSKDLGQYCERFKEACEDSSNHDFPEKELLKHFHEGLNTISGKDCLVH
ncbi:Retrotransposon gag protein [Corchorus capsularis]|uniref:Retrotransposon gag protein n=1 Tax=Corchorus capsularis TaxID=210143 RepID=A0A1R3J589_COCAP|nr:Retrotransposon gag protein [Corchorus capsularis]